MPARSKVIEPGPAGRYAILTGDVVGSTRLGPAARRALPRALQEAASAARTLLGSGSSGPALDIFRGDSWQWVIGEAHLAPRAALFIRAHLRGHPPDPGTGDPSATSAAAATWDTRIAIGIGPVDFLPRTRISQGDGPAFRASGQALEAMPRHRRLALSVADRPVPETVDALLALMDALMSRWTPRQARAVADAMGGGTQAEIGASWDPPVRQQVIARHLQAAHWDAFWKSGLPSLENTLRTL